MKKPCLHLFTPPVLLLLFFLPVFIASGSEAATAYKVKRGDTFYGVAKKYHISLNDLTDANPSLAKGIKPGDKIIVPSKKMGANKKRKPAESEKEIVSHEKTLTENSTVDKITEPSKESPRDIYHLVRKGDTLTSISRTYSLSLTELRDLNGLKKSSKLKNGQRLLVKSAGPTMYTVRKGDNIWSIAKKHSLDAEELMEINEMESPSLKVGQKLLLEEEEPVLSEIPNNEVLTKHLEEELKNVSESDDFSQKSLRDKLTLFAKKLINIPYKFGGNSILGIDCSAYVKKVYGLLGLELPRTAREQFNEGERIDKEELSMGDLVFFRTYASFPSHVGIYLGNNLFIHASSTGKKVKVSNLDAPYFVKRFIGAKRLLNDESKSVDPES